MPEDINQFSRLRLVTKSLTNYIKNQVKLMAVVATREQRAASKQLSENTSDSPDIDCLAILDEQRKSLVQCRKVPLCTS